MPRPTAAVLVTGSELLLGLVTDTNSGFLGRELDRLGLDLRRVVTVDDGREAVEDGLRSLLGHDVVITSGGLGPTHDDVTVAAVAAVAGDPLVLHEPTLRQIGERTAAFARERGTDPAAYADGNRKQALVPASATVLAPVGTAPGLLLSLGATTVAVLPGPPSELRRMWAALLEQPAMAALVGEERRPRRVLRVYGTGESVVANAFAEAGGDVDGTETTICARRMEVEVLVRATRDEAADRLAGRLRELLGDAVYATDERLVEEHVLDAARAQGLTLGLAESCTAGLVASRLGAVPGASDVLLGGIVSYANEAKRDLLGVPEEVLRRHGAVSAESAAAMAAGARRALGAALAVAVTGIAGPGGGTPEKPVGLVYLHAVGPDAERRRRLVFPGARREIQEWAATVALHELRLVLAGQSA